MLWIFHAILRDSLLFQAEITVFATEDKNILWESQVNKITVPGREVDVSLEGKEGQLKTVFTIYPEEGNHIMLLAKNETWYADHYHIAMTTFSMNYRDEVFYFPLGQTGDEQIIQPVDIRMKISIVPYLDTLSQESRHDLESILDSSTQFKLTGKDR